MLKEIYQYRSMVASLVKRDLRGRYKASVLGFFWTFLNPLLQIVIYSVVFSTILKSGIDKYYLHLCVVLIPWIFFASSLTAGSMVIVGNSSMIKKIYFPREVMPIFYVTSSFINMLLSFIVVFIIIFIAGIHISLEALLFLPLVMIIEYILALGIAFITSSITVYFRDMQQILGLLNMAWMYLTPVVYSDAVIPEQCKFIININPMTSIVISFRDILYYGRVPNGLRMMYATVSSFIVLFVGLIIFSKLKKVFAEEL